MEYTVSNKRLYTTWSHRLLTAPNAALQTSNSSRSGIIPVSNSSHSPAIITTGPHSSSSGCPPCLVFVSEGGANMLSKVVWYETPVPVTMDTVSVVLSQYRNTTITSSTTIHGDLQKLNGTRVPAEQSLRDMFTEIGRTGIRMQFNNYYASLGPFVLANGTDGAIGAGATSIAYPTPYLGINGFLLLTSLSESAESLATPGVCLVSSASQRAVVQGAGLSNLAGLGGTTIILSSTYYSPIPGMALTGTNVPSIIENFYQNVGMDTSSFSAFLQSNTALMSSFPMLASCLYQPYGFGPPAFKIPVSAMTTTTTATSQITGNPPGHIAPGNPLKPPIPPQTIPRGDLPKQPTPTVVPSTAAEPKSPSPSQQTQDSPIQSPPESNPRLPQTFSSQQSPESPPQGQTSQGVPPQQSQGPVGQISSGLPAPPSPINPPDINSAAPVISYASKQIQPDKSSQYILPEIGTIQAGGSPLTVDNVVYSKAPSAAAIHSDGIIIPITPVANQQPAPSPSPQQPPVLSLGDSSYTADASSNFIVGSQTIVAGNPAITIFGTPVSLAPGGSIALIGSSTAQLVPQNDNPPPQSPVLTLGSVAYIADSSSNFVIGSQTIAPGSPAITVFGTPVSLAPGASIAIIGSSTAQLVPQADNVPQKSPVITVGGAAYTADSSSRFVIGSQTITFGSPGIVVSGTPISVAPGGSIAVVGSSTAQLFAQPANSPTTAPVLNLGGMTYTANTPFAAFTIAGQTLLPGGSLTVSGTPIYYPATGGAIVIGGTSTQTILPPPTITPLTTTFAGSTYTADTASAFHIGSQTLAPGGTITVSGTPITYANSGSIVFTSSTSTDGLGGIIMDGFGTGPPSSTGTAAAGTSTRMADASGNAGGERKLMLLKTVIGVIAAIGAASLLHFDAW